MPPGTGPLDALSQLVAFRLLLHILMLSKAGMGLAVLVYSMGLIIPGRGSLGYDDTD